MNEPIEETVTDAASAYCAEADRCIARNPATAILFAIGAGVAIGLCVRALRPQPTARDRLAQVLEDLECRVRDRAEPVIRRATELASDGLQNGEARLERLFRDGSRRVRKFFA